MSKIVIISGSPNAGSRLNGMLKHIEQQLAKQNLSADTISVVSLPAEDLVQANFTSEAILTANKKVEEAAAVIIASPVYKASYTGVLKAYIDLLPQKGFLGKIITPIFIGGSMAHLLSIDYSLKPVLASMGAKHYTGSVYAVDSMINRTQDNEGTPVFELSPELIERLNAITDELLEELVLRGQLIK